MTPEESPAGWGFFRIALLVTGQGEEQFLPNLFRSLVAEGHCAFSVARRVPQLGLITSPRRRAKMVGTGKSLTTRDEELGLAARRCFQDHRAEFVILVDDLEHDRAQHAGPIYGRYRGAFDRMLSPLGLQSRASVHFLVNMVEAYYFAHATAINAVLNTTLEDEPGDVEMIRHPKNELKRLFPAFDEIKHGRQIVALLDLVHVLARPETCRSLRTLVGWCSRAIGRPFTDVYQLASGRYSEITRAQVDDLPG